MAELRQYQEAGIEFLQEHPHAMLADEMGLGKSAQLAGAAVGNTLVIAPSMVIDSGTWDTQVELWADDPSRFHQATYSNLTGRVKTEKGGTSPTNKLHPHLDRNWDTVILDEAHYIKNANATRTQAVRKICKSADRVYLATGTPIPNWPHELFVPLQLIRPEDSRPKGELGSLWRWREEWFKLEANKHTEFGINVLGLLGCTPACGLRQPTNPCEHFQRFARENFKGRFLQRMRDDVLTDLPPLEIQLVNVAMTPTQTKEYRRMAKEYLAVVDDEELVAWSTSAKNTILDKMTTGLGIAFEDQNPLMHSAKLDQLRADLSQRTRPTVIAAHYQRSVEACARVAHELGLSTAVIHGGTSPKLRRAAVEGFQNGYIDVLCGSLETISEGLTLTAADMLIQVETSYKPSRNQQVIRRIHRMGQERSCTVRDYLTTQSTGKPSLDGRKRELLSRKTDSQTRTLTAAQFKQLLRD